jgi:hypothetical protein
MRKLNDLFALLPMMLRILFNTPGRAWHKTKVILSNLKRVDQYWQVYRWKRNSLFVKSGMVDIGLLVHGHNIIKDDAFYERLNTVKYQQQKRCIREPIKILLPYMIVLDGNHRIGVYKDLYILSTYVDFYVLPYNCRKAYEKQTYTRKESEA